MPDEGGGPTGPWGIRRSGPPTLPGVSEVVARAGCLELQEDTGSELEEGLGILG